jgi:alkanesulfonate monooxygenase SsuD/methylene tetrahydromethanopterin reductase-like flavin-dependent oxidoreductase (luciferase family)
MAQGTQSVRIGPLVGNPVLRHPAVVAKAAVALDHLSGGRLELALGKGVEQFDHMAVGAPYWDARERSGRFREYVTVVDGVLRSSNRPFTFEGRYYATRETTVAPAPVQCPPECSSPRACCQGHARPPRCLRSGVLRCDG